MEIAVVVRRVTWVGLVFNLILSGIKMFAGVYGNSQAVAADAIHSLSDTTTDIAVIVGSYFWTKPPDEDHPYGHKRIETIVTVFIGVVVLVAGVKIGWDAMQSLGEGSSSTPRWPALAAALASIIIKESLYRWTDYKGKSIKSTALSANAWHHRLDAFSSIPAFIAVGVAMIKPGWAFVDAIGALIVCVMILQAAIKIILPQVSALIDTGATTEECEAIVAIARGVDGVLQVHGLRTRYSGSSIYVDMHLVVDGGITVHDGHEIAEEVKRKIIGTGPGVIDVNVHIEPESAAIDSGSLKNSSFQP